MGPEDKLLMGKQIASFDKKLKTVDIARLRRRTPNIPSLPWIEKKKGTVLDNDVQSGRYVANPALVLGQLLASGAPLPDIDFEEGKIIAGDPAVLDVLTIDPLWEFKEGKRIGGDAAVADVLTSVEA